MIVVVHPVAIDTVAGSIVVTCLLSLLMLPPLLQSFVMLVLLPLHSLASHCPCFLSSISSSNSSISGSSSISSSSTSRSSNSRSSSRVAPDSLMRCLGLGLFRFGVG